MKSDTFSQVLVCVGTGLVATLAVLSIADLGGGHFIQPWWQALWFTVLGGTIAVLYFVAWWFREHLFKSIRNGEWSSHVFRMSLWAWGFCAAYFALAAYQWRYVLTHAAPQDRPVYAIPAPDGSSFRDSVEWSSAIVLTIPLSVWLCFAASVSIASLRDNAPKGVKHDD